MALALQGQALEDGPFRNPEIENKGTLYIVATPIGNLGDITRRALDTLARVDVIAAEDTRHTLKLLTHFDIHKPLISYWGEKEKAKAEEVIKRLGRGEDVALVSDAGTPGISDPGEVLVREALARGFEVEAVPGVSALTAALSVSGLPTEEFTFIGFLPSKRGARLRRLGELELEPRTLVFYESPHRVIDTLIDMEEAVGAGRPVAVFKELTKMYERVMRGTLREVLDLMEVEDEPVVGEYVIVLGGKVKERLSFDEALLEVLQLIKRGMGRKEATRMVSEQYGYSKKELYDRSLEGG